MEPGGAEYGIAWLVPPDQRHAKRGAATADLRSTKSYQEPIVGLGSWKGCELAILANLIVFPDNLL